MMRKLFSKIWVWPAVVVVLTLLPFVAVQSEELAKEQVAQLAASVADIETVDPHFAVKIGEVPIVRMIYESLVSHPRGEINIEKLEPSLAESWEVGPDKLTWTFRLRKGVKWHEGYGEFIAEDVKFTIDRIRNPDVGSPFRKNLDVIESITIVDPYTIEIKTKQIKPDLPAILVNNQALTSSKKEKKDMHFLLMHSASITIL